MLRVMVYKISFGFNTKTLKCTWKKYQRRAFLNYCRLYIFKIWALWHANLVVKKRIPLLSKLFQYLVTRSSIVSLLDRMVVKYLISRNIVYVLHTFRKVKKISFSLQFCFFRYINSTCIHNNIFRVCNITSSWNLCPNIQERKRFKMLPNVIGFVNRLLR